MTDFNSILRALREQTKTKLSDKEADGYLELVKMAVAQGLSGDALSVSASGVCVDILSAVQTYIMGSGESLMFLSPIDEKRLDDLELMEAKKSRS